MSDEQSEDPKPKKLKLRGIPTGHKISTKETEEATQKLASMFKSVEANGIAAQIAKAQEAVDPFRSIAARAQEALRPLEQASKMAELNDMAERMADQEHMFREINTGWMEAQQEENRQNRIARDAQIETLHVLKDLAALQVKLSDDQSELQKELAAGQARLSTRLTVTQILVVLGTFVISSILVLVGYFQ